MKENHISKMKSLLVAIFMIASTMFVFVMVENVKAAPVSPLPGAFSILTIDGKTATSGIDVYGQVEITWNASMISRGETSATIGASYNVTISQKKSTGHGTDSWLEAVGNGNSTSYLWNTTQWADGIYYINVTAINVTDGAATLYWTNATNGPMKVEVHNNIKGVPGVSVWRGANYTVHKNYATNAGRIFSTVTIHNGTGSSAAQQISLEAGDQVSITLDSGYAENMTSDLSNNRFYLCYPVYNGSEADTTFNVRWKRATAVAWIDNTINNYVFGDENTDHVWLTDDGTSSGYPVAGLWIIDDTNDWSNADCSNASNFNATVPAWFWVNTSTDYTVTPSETTWAYNASGYITLDVDDAAGSNTAATIDIRRESNDSSIYDGNKYAGAGGHSSLYWYKNNSLNKVVYGEAAYGFWSVGNYTARAYFDYDYYHFDTSRGAEDRLQYTGYTNMGNTGSWKHYNNTYGASSNKNLTDTWNAAASKYNWLYAGPWDPPEHNATFVPITVTTGTPFAEIPTVANRTMYFDFDGEINISMHEDPSSAYLDKVNVSIYAQNGTNITHQFVLVTATGAGSGTSRNINWDAKKGKGMIDVSNISKGYIRINHSSWGKDTGGHAGAEVTPFGDNGTWTIKLYADTSPTTGDRSINGGNKQWTEEWNKTITFQVASSIGRLIFTMIDDDGNVTGGTNTDGVIRRVPQDTRVGTYTTKVPVKIQFNIQNQNHRYLGGYPGGRNDAMKNITLSGDALFLEDGALTLDKYPERMVDYNNDQGYGTGNAWTIMMIPTMNVNGGTITLSIDWGSFGTHTETITIGGTGLNGTIVEISPSTFAYGKNVTLTVTVKNPDGSAVSGGAAVSLYWLKDNGGLGDKINTSTTPDVSYGNTYSFKFNTTQQSSWQINSSSKNGWDTIKAPRNITAYANVTYVGKGYAKAKMEAVKDLKVTIEPSEVMAGKVIGPKGMYINVTTIGDDGNTTGRPQSSGLKVRLYNSTGYDVTARIGSFTLTELDGNYKYYNFTGEYFREPGVYTVHVYNNTHKSWEATNATLTVTAVHVECNLEYFIWGVDKNISATFTVTYKGEPINNSGFADYLRIDNVSKKGSGSTQYNKTWANTSFGWAKNGAGADAGGTVTNASLEVSKYSGGLVNGVVTINDITANNLDERLGDGKGVVQPSQRKIHFCYKANSESMYANCTGEVLVRIPDVAASPTALPYNEAAELMLTVTGRGVGLGNVRVNITVPGMTAFSGAQTNSEGVVLFAFTPPATGDITIRIENRTSSVKVPVTLWSLYVDVPSQVNEGESFTVTIRNGSATGARVAGATVTIRGIGTETTNTNGEATFTAPSVTSDRDYTISATLEGHAEDTETITVINVPKLIIVIPDEVQATTTFEVAVADDTGGAIVGAIITFNEKTYTTGVNGIAKLTAPKTKGDYPIEATFGTYVAVTGTVTVTAAPGIPGFELLTLIAALGVAFILFRRRRRR